MSAAAVIIAAPGLREEAELVSQLGRPGSPLTLRRRCVDALDLLGAAAEGGVAAAVVSAGLPRLTRDTIARLVASGVRVVGLSSGGGADLQALEGLDLPCVDIVNGDCSAAVAALAEIVGEPSTTSVLYARDDARATRPPTATGTLIAVWGPTGAPGRTSVAVTLADEWARLGRPALVVDSDTVGGGAVAAHLGVIDDTSGIVVACRQADTGRLGPAELAAAARTVDGRLRVLTGIPRPDRWAELRPAALARLWRACRETPGVTVADVGFSLERDEEILTDMRAPRRAAATLTALTSADAVIAVGSADPVGMERLIFGIADLRRLIPDTPIRVLVNRVRRSVLGGDPEGQVRDALSRHAGIVDVTLVPEDRESFDAALRHGRTLGDVAARCAARGILREFASSWAWSDSEAAAA